METISQSNSLSNASYRERLLLEHLPMVKAIAMQVRGKLPVSVDVEDLTQAGVLGLIDAMNRYDDTRMVSFSAFAKHRVRGAILDSLRQQDPAPRQLRRQHREAENAARDLATELKRMPSEEEIAGRMGIQLDDLRHMRATLQALEMVSSSTNAEGDERPVPEVVAEADTQPDFQLLRGELRGTLAVVLQQLPERHRLVIQHYYSDEMTMQQISRLLGITEGRVSQIRRAALMRMHGYLQQAGITSTREYA